MPPRAQTEGEVRKVDVAAQKLTVKHGRIENLGMSPMTMVFRVKDPAFLAQVKPGDQIKMRVERIDGALTIVALATRSLSAETRSRSFAAAVALPENPGDEA